METNSTNGILEIDSLAMLELALEAERTAEIRFPELGAELVKTEVQLEQWSSALPELETIFPLHWKEIALFQDKIAMGVDKERYANLEKLDMLMLVTARAEKKLVGYYIAFLMPHPHYFGAGLWAVTDMYFVLPEYRHGTGLKLFVAFEKFAKAKGAIQAVTSCKLHQDRTEFLEKLGWLKTDFTFQKHLCP